MSGVRRKTTDELRGDLALGGSDGRNIEVAKLVVSGFEVSGFVVAGGPAADEGPIGVHQAG